QRIRQQMERAIRRIVDRAGQRIVRRVVGLGCAQRVAGGVEAAEDQHASVGEERGRLTGAGDLRGGGERGERLGGYVVQFGAGERAAAVGAAGEDGLRLGQRRRGMRGAPRRHRIGERGGGERGAVEQLGRRGNRGAVPA